MITWMMEDFGEYIDARQFGSLKGSSTTYCLLDLIHNWLSEPENPGCYLRACFLDFSKASDRINHTIVITKLIELGLCRFIIPWICSFLTERRQCVKIGQSTFQWLPVNAGVPQGPKIGPILFVIMHDKRSKIGIWRCSHWKYVDDVTISEVVPARATSTLQSELDALNSWAE